MYWAQSFFQHWRRGCNCRELGLLLLRSLRCSPAAKSGFMAFLKSCLLTPCLILASGRILKVLFREVPALTWAQLTDKAFSGPRTQHSVDAELHKMPGSCIPEESYFYCISIFPRRREKKYLKEQNSSCWRWSYKSIPPCSPALVFYDCMGRARHTFPIWMILWFFE